MDELLNIIKEWPVIIQGALGSGLFWLFLLISQKLITKSINLLSNRSKSQRKSWLVSRFAKLRAFSGTESVELSHYSLSAVKYRALRPAYKGFTWLSLGLATYPLFDLGLTIGGLGAVYFFLKAYEIVSPMELDDVAKTQERNNTHDELTELGLLPKREPITESEN